MSDYNTIKKKIQTLEEQLRQATDVITRIDCMNELANDLFVYDVDRALNYSREARKLALHENYEKGVATSYNKEALCCRIRSDFKRSIQLSREAFKIFDSINDKAGAADSLNNVAFMEVNVEDYKS